MVLPPITPIQPIQPLGSSAGIQKSSSSAVVPFRSAFEDAVRNVQETQNAVDAENYKLATGQSDDLHNIEIASTKATASVELLTQLRNKVLDAYNEVMRMSV